MAVPWSVWVLSGRGCGLGTPNLPWSTPNRRLGQTCTRPACVVGRRAPSLGGQWRSTPRTSTRASFGAGQVTTGVQTPTALGSPALEGDRGCIIYISTRLGLVKRLGPRNYTREDDPMDPEYTTSFGDEPGRTRVYVR